MKLLAIIVNFRTAKMTLDAADALMRAIDDLPDSRLLIVENHSEDGSYQQLVDGIAQRADRDRIEVIDSPRNGGFGFGCNFGFRHNLQSADPAEYFYLLNSDAFPEPDAVKRLVEFLDNHRYVGIAGSYVQGPDKVPHETAFRFPSLVSELESGLSLGVVSKILKDWIVPLPIPEGTRQVDWLAGASMMIRREVLEKIGLFDEEFFLYFEETDLCRRAMLAGFPTYYLRDSVVTHIGSVSTGMKEVRRMPRYWFDSRRHYFRKHHGDTYLHGANVAWAAAHLSWQARRQLQRKKENPHPPWFLVDFLKHNFLPERLR